MTVQPKSLSNHPSFLQFSDNLYYRFDGDQAQLGAQLHVNDTSALQHQRCTLQLWACSEPFAGGELNGVRIAEVPVATLALAAHIQQQAPALYPAGQNEYAMVMALVTESSDGQPVINDYVNFNLRQRFVQPRLNGDVEVRFEGQQAHVRIASIENPRDDLNLSGTLSVEIWSTRSPSGISLVDGRWLAGINLGQLAGGEQWADQQFVLDLQAAAVAGENHFLLLQEWTADGFVTRDYRLLPAAEVVPAVTAKPSAPKAEPVKAAVVDTAADAEKTKAKSKAKSKAKPEVVEPKTVLSVNHASEAELAKVQGLNARIARLIVAGRPYAKLDELLKVRGIGERMLVKLRSWLSL